MNSQRLAQSNSIVMFTDMKLFWWSRQVNITQKFWAPRISLLQLKENSVLPIIFSNIFKTVSTPTLGFGFFTLSPKWLCANSQYYSSHYFAALKGHYNKKSFLILIAITIIVIKHTTLSILNVLCESQSICCWLFIYIGWKFSTGHRQ